MLPERREPTHTIIIEIPLHSDALSPGFDVYKDVIKLVLGVSRAAYVNAICDTPNVTIEET